VYCNEGSLETSLNSLLSNVFGKFPELTGEIIFVDDGSSDGSMRELMRLREENPGIVVIIALTRNFGQPYARLAGLSQARGDCVITMSADGQEPAELAREMLQIHRDEKYEVVICVRKSRKESLYRKITSSLFFRLMRKTAFPEMPIGGFSSALLSRRALEVLLGNQEAHPFFQGQILWTGFPYKLINYDRPARASGRSKWTFGKKLTLLVDAVVSYSFFPIRFISLLGILSSFLGFLGAAFILGRRLALGTAVPGWTTLMVVTLFLGGLQILMLGVLGEYLWRTLAQVRARAPYVIKSILDSTPYSRDSRER